MTTFPGNCRYGKRYQYNSLRPDISNILPDFQTYGSGYLAASSTDANGIHVDYFRPVGGSLEYPTSDNFFPILNFSGDFELTFDLKYVGMAIGTGFVTFCLEVINLTAGYCKLEALIGTSSSNSGIRLTVYPGSVFKNLPAASNLSWHRYDLKKIGSTVWGCFDDAPACSISWPGYSSTTRSPTVGVVNANTGIRDFNYDVRNIRVVTNTGTACLGGEHGSDLTKI